MRGSNLAIAAAATLGTLLAAEVAVRLGGGAAPREPIAPQVREVEGGRVLCPDSRVTRPYFEQRERHPGCAFYPRNNIGTRNLFDVRDEGGRILRILGIGDSLIYGYGVDHEDTFLFKLQQALATRPGAGRVEVINAGWPGYDLEDAYRLLVDKGLRVRPELVVLGVHFNDFLPFPARLIRETWDHPLRERLRLLDVFLGRLELARSGETHQRELLEAWDATARARVSASLRRFRSTLGERGVALLVLIFPLLMDLDDYPFAHIHRDLAASLDAEGIDHIDLLPRFAGARARDYWVTSDDQHPNERANQIFFEELLAFLDRSGLSEVQRAGK